MRLSHTLEIEQKARMINRVLRPGCEFVIEMDWSYSVRIQNVFLPVARDS
jgi:hypothetical protein